MSLALNIYADKNSKTTTEDLRAFLLEAPHFRDVQNGEFEYLNESTGVYFVVGNEPVEQPVKGFRSLDMAFTVSFGRAEFFALEVFPVIEDVCNKLGLLIDNEQQGKLQKPKSEQLHEKWLKVNDGFLKRLQKEHADSGDDLGVAYMPRKASNELWRFLFGKESLQAELIEQGLDVYVAQPLYFREKETNKVVTAVAWPECIPIVLPPHTDYVYLIGEAKKRFFSSSPGKMLGYVSIEHVLEVAGDAFTKRSDGSLQILPADADKIRKNILGMQIDIPPDQSPGQPIAQDLIVDVR
jgi:hypothetical protein